ncbi:MAG: DoxX family membrane protein [Desulfovibrionaceae bacterium]|nr:DoxX family membrane protein [Desulfovibrionaceae bacterium]
MKSILTGKAAYLLLRFILGGLFVYAGVLKLSDPGGFAMTINLYGLVSWRLSNVLAYAIPTVEILSGLGLILDVRGSLAIITAQLLGFMCILLYALHIGLDADCGCFGTPRPTDNDPEGPLEALLRDGVMLIGCAVIYWQRNFGGHQPRSLTALFRKQR